MSELNRTFVATAIGVFGAMSMLAGGITQQSGDSTSTMVKVENLDPYTHLANIPADSDLSSIRFQGVKKVKVATERKSITDVRDCADQQFRDPGGSMYCPYTQDQSPATAYRVTYSYRG